MASFCNQLLFHQLCSCAIRNLVIIFFLVIYGPYDCPLFFLSNAYKRDPAPRKYRITSAPPQDRTIPQLRKTIKVAWSGHPVAGQRQYQMSFSPEGAIFTNNKSLR